MKKCIEPNCEADSHPKDVFDGVQTYECTTGHRWGIVKGANEEEVRKQVKAAEVYWVKTAA